MFIKQPTITKYLSQPLTLFISLVILLNTTSCSCKNPQTPPNGPAATVELRISKLVYDSVSHSIIYNIENGGKKVAQHVQLRYTNISEDASSKAVLLANKKTDVIDLEDIAGEHSTDDHTLVIDYKTATQATFRFELIYEGTIICTQEIKVSTQPIKLQLIPTSCTLLIGANKTIKFTLIKERGSGTIYDSKVTLLISKHPTNTAKIYYNDKEVIDSLPGSELKANMEFIIHPDTLTEVSFNFQLLYNNTPVGDPQSFTWQAELNEATKKLFEVIAENKLEEIKQLLNSANIQVNATYKEDQDLLSGESWSLLHQAIAGKNIEIIKLLIKKGANVNTIDQAVGGPLHLAVEDKNNSELIKLLLDNGANVNIPGGPNNKTPLHIAVITNNLNYMTLLLDKNANVNAKDDKGDTPLHKAAQKGNLAIVKRLLRTEDIDINTKDNKGNTPLHQAAQKGNLAIVKQLLKAKDIEVNAMNNEGNTPLHTAVQIRDEKIVNLLLKAKDIEVNAVNNKGSTPLDLILSNTASSKTNQQNMKMINLLLNKEAKKGKA